MNRERRKTINEAIKLVEQANELLEKARELVESAKDDEQDYLDAMPENLQGSERYDMAQTAINELENAVDSLNEFIDGNTITSLEEAAA